MSPKLAIILIIIGAGMSGIVYASSTVISDTGIITPGCTGCLTPLTTYSTWATALNETIAGTSTGTNIGLLTGIDGSVVTAETTSKSAVVKLDGTVVNVQSITPVFDASQEHISQSVDGTYKVILSDSANGIFVYKNNVLIQTIHIKTSQFFGTNFDKSSVSISSDGKYISISGEDTGGALQRLVIFQGS